MSRSIARSSDRQTQIRQTVITDTSAGPEQPMNPEETNVEMKDAAETKDAEPKDADPPQVVSDADATEADVSEADLDQEEQEKQPMTGGEERAADASSAGGEASEKNGSVKLKIPEEAKEEAVTFTGLSKEELLRVAGTPGLHAAEICPPPAGGTMARCTRLETSRFSLMPTT
ncbi:hypothetical protein PAMP_006198 [Pampus punctatissimus]